METNMLSADHSVYTLIIRNPSTPDLFINLLKNNVKFISIFCQKFWRYPIRRRVTKASALELV